MNKVTLAVSLCTLTALAITGCSSSGSSRSNSNNTKPPAVIQGYVGTSNIYSALVYLVPVDVQGQPGKNDEGTGFAGSNSSSDKNAYYSGTLDSKYLNSPAVFIAKSQAADSDKKIAATMQNCEVVSGCYNGINYNTSITIPKDELTLNAAIGNVQTGMQVNINWITTLAADLAYTSYIDENGNEGSAPTTAKDGMYTRYTIERGNLWMNSQFDLSDVISLRPIAPSKLNQFPELASGVRSEAIRYGALLAAGQKLAQEASKTEVDWLKEVIDQQRFLQNQLYKNHSSEFSMCKLYGAAATVLESNIGQLGAVPQEANQELAYLNTKKAGYCAQDNNGQVTAVDVPWSEIKSWVAIAENAKKFVRDLNERLVNLKGDMPNTCTSWNPDPTQGCIDSFFDPKYVQRTEAYYNELKDFYRNNNVAFTSAYTQLRDGVQDFIKCIHNSGSACSDYTEKDGVHSYKTGDLTLILEPDHSVKEGDKFYAFNFKLSGFQTINGSSKITYNSVTSSDGKTTDYPRVRVVYNQASDLPPVIAVADEAAPLTMPTDGTEPLGFDFYFPKLDITEAAGITPSLSTLMTLKMIGVKPHRLDSSDTELPYHYNITEASLVTNAEGGKLGSVTEDGSSVDLKNKVSLNFSAKATSAPDYYAKHVWPNMDDFFTAEGGGNVADSANNTIANLFSYTLVQQAEVIYYYDCDNGKGSFNEQGECKKANGSVGTKQPIKIIADYFQIEPKGLGINRYELFKVTDERLKRTYQILRSCALTLNENDEPDDTTKICSSGSEVTGEDNQDFNLLTDLFAKKDGQYTYLSYFALPGFGAYEPQFPATMDWTTTAQLVDGKRQAKYSQGISDLSLLIDQRFIDENDSKVSKAPLAIAKLNMKKQSATSWEVAVSVGYDYQYLVDVLPIGEKAQSIYLSYFVNESTDADSKRLISELGGLSILRSGTSVFGAEKGAVGLTVGSRVGYSIDTSKSELCGYTSQQESGLTTDKCNAVAYLAFRGSLVAVIRQERKGVYVARFSDGDFIILGEGV